MYSYSIKRFGFKIVAQNTANKKNSCKKHFPPHLLVCQIAIPIWCEIYTPTEMQLDNILEVIPTTAIQTISVMFLDIRKSVSFKNDDLEFTNWRRSVSNIDWMHYLSEFLDLIVYFSDERHFLSGYDSALFYGAYAYQYDREASGRQYRY